MVQLERNALLKPLALRFASSTAAGGPGVLKVMGVRVCMCGGGVVCVCACVVEEA